jgi:hypothetical protein
MTPYSFKTGVENKIIPFLFQQFRQSVQSGRLSILPGAIDDEIIPILDHGKCLRQFPRYVRHVVFGGATDASDVEFFLHGGL